MTRPHILALALVACAPFGACLGASIEPHYYMISGANPEPVVNATQRVAPTIADVADTGARAAAAATPWPLSLVVARFETQFVYDRLELVYRPAPHELRFDAYRLWAARPGRMLSDAVADHLRATGRFAAVSTHPPLAADFELRGLVERLEEVDHDKTHWTARLAMRFELVALPGDQVVWRHAFDTERALAAPRPGDVVTTLDAILADELARLSAGLDQYLATRTQARASK